MAYVFFRLNQRGPQNEQHVQTWYSWSQYMLPWVAILMESRPDLNAFMNNNVHSTGTIPVNSTGTIPVIQVIYFLMLHTTINCHSFSDATHCHSSRSDSSSDPSGEFSHVMQALPDIKICTVEKLKPHFSPCSQFAVNFLYLPQKQRRMSSDTNCVLIMI